MAHEQEAQTIIQRVKNNILKHMLDVGNHAYNI